MEIKQIKKVEANAIKWLIICFHKTKDKGFAHSRHQYLPSWMAWKNIYPETTGYLIENILEFNKETWPNAEYIAKCCLDYLIELQHTEFYFYKGLHKKEASFFNTAQILFGLNVGYKYFKDERYLQAYLKAKQWCLDSILSDGKILKGLYVSDYMASYYARAIWALCQDQNHLEANVEACITKLTELFDGNHSFRNGGFHPNKKVINHSYFYTLEGFFELNKSIQSKDIDFILNRCIQYILELYATNKKIPAWFDVHGEPDFSQRCITGEAQLVSLLAKMCLLKYDQHKHLTATELFKQIASTQVVSENDELSGAFPSSIPSSGSYFPYRYVNWTNKFVLDACYYLRELTYSSKVDVDLSKKNH